MSHRMLQAAALVAAIIVGATPAVAAPADAPTAPPAPAAILRAETHAARRWLWMGDVAYQLGDPLIALQCYERALATAPDAWYAKRATSKIQWVRGKPLVGP